MPFARLKIDDLRKALIKQGAPQDKVQALQGKKQLAFRLSWILPNGLPIVISVTEWPNKQQLLHVKLAPVVGFISGSLVFSWSPSGKLDLRTPVADLPTSPTEENVYIVELDAVVLYPEPAEKRVARANPAAKRKPCDNGPEQPLSSSSSSSPTPSALVPAFHVPALQTQLQPQS